MEITKERAAELRTLINESGGGSEVPAPVVQALESLLQGVTPAALVSWTYAEGTQEIQEIVCLSDRLLIRVNASWDKGPFTRERVESLSESEKQLTAWAVPLSEIGGVDLVSVSSGSNGWRSVYRVRVSASRSFEVPRTSIYSGRQAAESFAAELLRRL